MITRTGAEEITAYLPFDPLSEGVGWITPKEGFRFIGVPWGHHAQNSTPYIQVVNEYGDVVETVNALDCRAIKFAVKLPKTKGVK
jgi:hypothetical protein